MLLTSVEGRSSREDEPHVTHDYHTPFVIFLLQNKNHRVLNFLPFEGIIKSYDSENLLRGYVDVTTEYENLAFMKSHPP